MSWLFSRALVEAYSEESSLGGEPCAQLNVMPTLQPFWREDRRIEFSSPSQFGLTCARLTEHRGAQLLTSYLADFPARISAPQAKAPASTESEAGCGDRWLGSLAKWDRASSSWKTLQCSFLEGLDVYSETWPRWGMMLDGACWALSMPEHLTSANESGSELNWPTPHGFSKDGKSNGPSGNELGRAVNQSLWPTPTVNGNYNKVGLSAKSVDGLATAVTRMSFPPPTVQDSKNNGAQSQMERNTKPLNAVVGGSLNPTWVEWLMGWPLGWTDLKASVTDKFQQWRLSHGRICGDKAEGPAPSLSRG
jgi:hypothetical protein